MANNLLVLLAVVLLPLIPACILYRFLPSDTMVKGPFQGLTVQLTGAFGGYFLVMLGVFGFYHTLPAIDQSGDEAWTISGRLQTPITNLSDLQLSVRPATTQIDEDGTFKMRVLVSRDQGKPELPTLIVQHPLYETVNVHFPDPGAPPLDCTTQVDDKDKTITIPSDCLHLTKKEDPPPNSFVTKLESVPEK